MRRRLNVNQALAPSSAVLAAFRGPPERWLPEPNAARDAGHWGIYLWAGKVGVLVDCWVSPPVRAGFVVSRQLRWQPLDGTADGRLSRMVPSFDGDVAVVDHGDGDGEIDLVGFYEPPGGGLGGMLDIAVMHLLARRTAASFLREIGRRLTHQAALRQIG